MRFFGGEEFCGLSDKKEFYLRITIGITTGDLPQ
jgi:hypothetical protein